MLNQWFNLPAIGVLWHQCFWYQVEHWYWGYLNSLLLNKLYKICQLNVIVCHGHCRLCICKFFWIYCAIYYLHCVHCIICTSILCCIMPLEECALCTCIQLIVLLETKVFYSIFLIYSLSFDSQNTLGFIFSCSITLPALKLCPTHVSSFYLTYWLNWIATLYAFPFQIGRGRSCKTDSVWRYWKIRLF